METTDNTVVILLAAYNGAAYLPEMIDSLLAQDTDDFRLVLSDDHSQDGTPALLADYAARFPEKIVYHDSGLRFGSAQKHFMYLLSRFGDSAPYFMFCDQDDVWHSDKVRKTLALMKKTETEKKLPALVHTDLRVVDQDLREMAPSFLHYSRLDGGCTALRRLLVQNVVTGCTVMVNRELARLAGGEIPEACLMHDWWLALLASACGRVGFLDEATMDYRQHGTNTVGAKDAGSLTYVTGKLRENRMKTAIFDTFDQAGALADRYAGLLPAAEEATLRDYGALARKGKLARITAYSSGGFWKQGLARRAGQLLWG